MAAAAAAVDFDSRHSITAVARRADGIVDRRPEARPPGTAVELCIRGEKFQTATSADKPPLPLLDVQRAGPSALGPVLAKHVKLFRRQGLPPFLVGVDDV